MQRLRMRRSAGQIGRTLSRQLLLLLLQSAVARSRRTAIIGQLRTTTMIRLLLLYYLLLLLLLLLEIRRRTSATAADRRLSLSLMILFGTASMHAQCEAAFAGRRRHLFDAGFQRSRLMDGRTVDFIIGEHHNQQRQIERNSRRKYQIAEIVGKRTL